MSSKNNKIKQNKTQIYFSLQSFFRMYLNAIKSKALFFFYPFSNKTIESLLKCLEKNSRIAGYQVFLKEQKVKIFLIYDIAKNTPLSQKITFYSSQGRKRIVTTKMLQQFSYQYPNALVIIETKYGLMDMQDCLRHQYGGEFLVSLM